MAASASAALTIPVARAACAEASPDAPFRFEIERTDAEWRAMLSPQKYEVLREGGTEFPTSSPFWDDYSPGAFACRGCDLPLYASEHRAEIEMGFVFFDHSRPNAMLTDLDYSDAYGMGSDGKSALMEVHCRRCGSHLGHIVVVQGALVHCINGTSLTFEPATV
jgi:peptide-methionine (R)-S-oxide reductase